MPTRPTAEPTSRMYVSQRLKLRYMDWGNHDAPPLILLHGGQDHCRNWDWVAEKLRDQYHIITPDLRGHGESEWSPDGHYSLTAHLYDLSQLIHQKRLAPLRIVGHSLGGNIALRFTGTFPEDVIRVAAIEGLGLSPKLQEQGRAKGVHGRLREWVESQRKQSGRSHRRYPSIDEALARMQAENAHLSTEQARHLTFHGMIQNEDGSYSWKFDNYSRHVWPTDIAQEELESLWGRITCPTLLIYGRESWASNPAEDGRLRHFRNARLSMYDRAGHWVHHDRLDDFVAELVAFLR